MSGITILIDGVDETADVVIDGATFISQVNGVAGEASFLLRDLDRTKTVAAGSPLVLEIDSEVVWRGYVATAERMYVFPALNVDDFGLSRFIRVTGFDINILLTKRIAFNKLSPTNTWAPLLPAHTADDDAIADLITDWLDLTGDGLDTTTFVENVGDTTWTQSGRAWSSGMQWGQAMAIIAALPAAIWYIDPDKNFVYTDVDTPNAAFGLSDQPNGTTTRGYREMTVIKDGTGLANDVLAWGIGYGGTVFTRDQDATSQSAHGLWQRAQLSYGVFEQDTIERIASSIIDGSPQSKRGAKDDRVAVECVTFEPGLRVAQKVDFTSNVFGFNDVIPIRKMEITFAGPETPRYRLTLSHEIDTPFNIIDNLPFPDFRLKTCPPGFILNALGKCVPIPTITIGDPECICGSTDTFTRVVADRWGTSDAGIPWAGTQGSSRLLYVDGTKGVIGVTTVNGSLQTVLMDFLATVDGTIDLTWDMSVTVQTTTTAALTDQSYGFQTTAEGATFGFEVANFSTGPTIRLGKGSGGTVSTAGPLTTGSLYHVRRQFESGVAHRVKVWLDGDPEPGSWTLEQSISETFTTMEQLLVSVFTEDQALSGNAPLMTGTFDNLDIPGLDRCTAVQFDNFERFVGSGWGVATPSGFEWGITGAGVGATVSVTDGSGQAVLATNKGIIAQVTDDGPWTTASGFTMTALCSPTAIPSSGGRYLFYEFAMLASGSKLLDLNVSTQAGTGSISLTDDGTDSVGFTAWPASGFWVKWERIPGGSSRAKVWGVGTTEPDWMVESTATGVPSAFVVLLDNSGNNVTATYRVDSIDFDYDGRPCYVDCSELVMWDDFERTEASSWGTASNGTAWTTGSGTASLSVDGTSGVFTSTTFNQSKTTTWNNSQSVAAPWYDPVGLQLRSAFMLMRFHFDFTPPGPGDGFVRLAPVIGNVATGPLIDVSNAAGSWGMSGDTVSKLDWAAGQVYVLTWEFTYDPTIDDGTVTVSLYDDGGSPSVYSTSGIYPDNATLAMFYSNQATTGPSRTFHVDEILFSECAPVDPTAGTGTTLNAWVCESSTSHGSDTIVLHSSFLPNSQLVFVSGILQQRTAYLTDPDAGTITLGFTPDAGTTLRVCFWSVP